MNYIRAKEHIPYRIRQRCKKGYYDRVNELGQFCGFTVYSLEKSSWENLVIGICPGPIFLYKLGILLRVIFNRHQFLFRHIKRIRKGENLIREWTFAKDNGFDVIHHVKTIGRFDYFLMYKSKKKDRRGNRSRLYATVEKGFPRLLSEDESKYLLAY